MDLIEIQSRIEQCKPLIKNWEAIEGLDLDFTKVDIESLLVDKHADKDGKNWKYILNTTMYSRLKDFGGREVYSIRWGFRDISGNGAFCLISAPETSGTLYLNRFDLGDTPEIDFSIIPNRKRRIEKYDQEAEETVFSYEDGDPFFTFFGPDEISIESVEKQLFQSLPDQQ